MHRLDNFLSEIIGLPHSFHTVSGIYCMEVSAEETFHGNKIMGRCACNVITLVTKGWISLIYDGRELLLTTNDLFIYTPGLTSNVLSASVDYHAIILLADEDYTFETPAARSLIRAAYLPYAQQHEPFFTLPESRAHHLKDLMHMCIHYINSDHLFKQDALKTLYSLFLLEIMDAQQNSKTYIKIPERAENIFINFIKLMTSNFKEQHSIAFYADKLNISTIYLSRIVKKISGRTVIEYINQMLLMEAIWLLQQPELSLDQVSRQLYFSSQASFTRFFIRMKGIPPKTYRNKITTRYPK